jgi:hypothetical protein
MGAHKMHRMALILTFFRVIPQRWLWISQSHRMSSRWWNLGFVCERWNQKAVKAVYAHIHQTSRKNVCLPESWWQLFSETRNSHNNVRSALWNTKRNCVGPAIRNKKRGMLTCGIVLLHDNAHLHTAVCTWSLLQHFNWELFDRPPYSPDLAPSNYHLFTYWRTGWDQSISTIIRS